MIIDLGDGEFGIGSTIIDGVACVTITPLGTSGNEVGSPVNIQGSNASVDHFVNKSIVIAVHTLESGSVLLNSVLRALALQSQILVADEIEQSSKHESNY